jgi:hypothetical protein
MAHSISPFTRCKTITQELLDNGLNQEFSHPVDPEMDGLKDYRARVPNPMDLRTISAKLNEETYTTPLEWYNDVCLVFENARAYHHPSTLWHQIATYNLEEFKKTAYGFGCRDAQEWYTKVNEAMLNLQVAISASPVPQGIDPMILSIIKRAESQPPLASQSIADVVERINQQIEDENVRYDVLSLLKETEPGLKIEGDKVTINADTLTDLSLNALSLYVKAHT